MMKLLLLFLLLHSSLTCGRKQGDALLDLYSSKPIPSLPPYKRFFTPSDDNIDTFRQKGSKEEDRILALPGQRIKSNVSQFGGYVTINISKGKAFYYYFVEGKQSKDSLPLLLWLNGGPGCSSLGFGAMQELGPFRVHSDGKTLYENPYSWHNVANVLFVESPAGVGFSYSNKTLNNMHGEGDKKTASDNYAFIVKWLERFPEFKGRDFYIAGESYAGHYVPQLAHKILLKNEKANKTIVNLRGVAIGNAAIDYETDLSGMYDFLGTHAITSPERAENIRTHCDFGNPDNVTDQCSSATYAIRHDKQVLNPYNIYTTACFDGRLTDTPKSVSVSKIDPLRVTKANWSFQLENFDTCSNTYVHAYLNRQEVQKAMHANVTNLPNEWLHCNDLSKFGWPEHSVTVLPLLKDLMVKGLRVWLYSGDVDGRVPVTSTQYALRKMNLKIVTEWYRWMFNEDILQTGGFVQVYKGSEGGELTFATVLGAGHEVPSYKPEKSLVLISSFLDGKPLKKGP